MINPIRLCNNLFEDEKFFDADLRSFAEDHLVRLAQPENNPAGIYSTLIADTNTKYTAYYGKMSSQAVKEAIAEGVTITKNNARKAAEEKISQLQGLVKFKFGEASAIYQEFYPLGAREYQDARDGEVGTLFDRFVVAATTHLTADFPLEVTAIDDLVDDFHDAYTARETVVSQVDILITGKNTDRIALTVQLTKNFLIIASNNIGNPDKFDDYYDPRFLPLSNDSGFTLPFNREGTLGPSVATTFNLMGLNGDNPAIYFVFENPGTTNMRIYTTNVAGGLPGAGPILDVPPSTTITKTLAQMIAELGLSEINHYLGVQNLGGIVGSYKITINE